MGGDRGVEGGEQLLVGDVRRPGDAQGPGGAPQPGEVPVVRGRQGAQDPDPGLAHEPRCADAGEEGDLRVPLLHREGGPEAQRVPAVEGDDLLLRDLEGDAPALPLLGEPQLTDAAQERGQPVRDGGVGPAVDDALDLRVAQLGAAVHQGPAHVDVAHRPRGVEHDAPQVGRPVLPRQEAGGPGAEHLVVERDGPGGPVDGDAASVHGGVEGTAGGGRRRRRRRSRSGRRARRRPGRCGGPGPGPGRRAGRW